MTTGPFTLPQKDDDAARRGRRLALEKARGLYQLTEGGGMPPSVLQLPPAERLGAERTLEMFDDIVVSGMEMARSIIDDIRERLGHERTFDYYDDFYGSILPLVDKGRRMPAVHTRWKRDDEFARQRLNGVNPVLIERCTKLPDHFPVDDAAITGLLPEGTTLTDEMAAGRVYVVDYAILDGLPTKPGLYLAAPTCLFHVAPDGRLLPLAIQLERGENAGPVFTPNDPPGLWLAVKMYAQSADAAYHEVASHLLRTHLVAETIYVCMMRNLATTHPLHQLLKPHFEKTLAINHAAKTRLITPGGPIDETMAAGGATDKEGNLQGSGILLGRAWKEWSFDRYDPKTDLRTRGVDDADLLPGYHYRDDSLRLWGILEKYVRTLLAIWYASDEDVAADTELQAWVAEMASDEGGQLKGLPGGDSLSTVDQLCQLLTQTIFNSTVEHASVNNGQYDYFGYVPNCPGALSEPPPRTKDDISEVELCKRMPAHHASAVQISMVHLLSAPTEVALGAYPPAFFDGVPHAQGAAAELRGELDVMSHEIEARNAKLDVPYTYLDPKLIGQSISV